MRRLPSTVCPVNVPHPGIDPLVDEGVIVHRVLKSRLKKAVPNALQPLPLYAIRVNEEPTIWLVGKVIAGG